MRDQKDSGVWDERKGLALCLERYLPNPATLKSAIDTFGSYYANYYKSSIPPFASKAKLINFDEADDVIRKSLVDRLYEVRCAIVHSKDGHANRYTPFKDDNALSKEIPLIRCVA